MTTIADIRAKLLHTTVLMHQWGDAERLCNELCHKLDWTHDGDTTRRLEAMLQRARKRAQRRYERLQRWHRCER